MATLKNCLPHMAGQTVKVNGAVYQIDEAGLVNIDDKSAVDKLLQNKAAWSRVAMQIQVTPAKTEQPKPVETSVEKPASKPVRKPVAKKVVVEPVKKTKKQKEQPAGVDNGGVDWPDPTPSMAIGYLRQMAEAYDVPFTGKTPKSELVKLIHAAMYDEAE